MVFFIQLSLALWKLMLASGILNVICVRITGIPDVVFVNHWRIQINTKTSRVPVFERVICLKYSGFSKVITEKNTRNLFSFACGFLIFAVLYRFNAIQCLTSAFHPFVMIVPAFEPSAETQPISLLSPNKAV